MKKTVFALSMALSCLAAHAQFVDVLEFGDDESEAQHGLVSFRPDYTKVVMGKNGETARTFLPDEGNPYSGEYTGVYGGECNLVMRVDGTQQNYITVKASGDDGSIEYISLEVNGKEVGNRYHGPTDVFFGDFRTPAPGAFFFRTMPLPRSLTDGKTLIHIRLRSRGRIWGYAPKGQYAKFQYAMDEQTQPFYKLYTHTADQFANFDDEATGSSRTSYTDAPTLTAKDFATLLTTAKSSANTYFNKILNGADYIATNSNNYYSEIEALALAYHSPYVTATYQKPAVITKLVKLIDNMCVNAYNGTQKADACWGGSFGRQGFAIAEVFDDIPAETLNATVNLGGGTNKTRRAQWAEQFYNSFQFGATTRKTITNQEMENDESVYGAALALYKLDPTAYKKHLQVAYHMAREACGLEVFTGKATVSKANATLGSASSSGKGANFCYMTTKGTTHEDGWVSPDCYGNLTHSILTFWRMSQLDDLNTEDGQTLAEKGGATAFLQKAVDHVNAQSHFTIPRASATDGKRILTTEGWCCNRNVYEPGVAYYGSTTLAGLSQDATVRGLVALAAEHGRLSAPTEFRATDPVLMLASLDTLAKAENLVSMLPFEGQDAAAWADEQNGVVSIKDGEEQIFLNFFHRDASGNTLRLHHTTSTFDRFAEMQPTQLAYTSTGSTVTRADWVNGYQESYGTPPDQAWLHAADAGEIYPNTSWRNTSLALKDLYAAHYGQYFIAMTTVTGKTKTVNVPASIVGKPATDLISGNTYESVPEMLTLTGEQTVVLKTTSQPRATTRTAVTSVIQENKGKLNAVRDGEVPMEELVSRLCVTPSTGNLDIALFNQYMRSLSEAIATENNSSFTDEEREAAKVQLDADYEALISQTITLNSTLIPSSIAMNKYSAKGGTLNVSAGGIDNSRNGMYAIYPVKARDGGDYTFSITARTMNGEEAKINLTLYEDNGQTLGVNDYDITQSQVLTTTDKTYKWTVHLRAGEVRLAKISGMKSSESWCLNASNFRATVVKDSVLLVRQFKAANDTLTNYSTGGKYAGKASETALATFSDAVAQAEAFLAAAQNTTGGTQSDEFYDALLTLRAALDAFLQSMELPGPTGSTFSTGKTFYLYNVGAKMFLGQGGAWNTQAILVDQGMLTVKGTKSGNSYTLLTSANTSNKYLFPVWSDSKIGSGTGSMFVDAAQAKAGKFTITEIDADEHIYTIAVTEELEKDPQKGYVSFQGNVAYPGLYYYVNYADATDHRFHWKFVTNADYKTWKDMITGIENVSYEQPVSGGRQIIYDLSGRVVGQGSDHTHLKKGIYIINGRKMMINNR